MFKSRNCIYNNIERLQTVLTIASMAALATLAVFHSNRRIVLAAAALAAILILANLLIDKKLLEKAQQQAQQLKTQEEELRQSIEEIQERFGNGYELQNRTFNPHFPLLRRLQSRQSIWQFSGVVLPPSCHGVMWSASICSSSKCLPHSGQMPN